MFDAIFKLCWENIDYIFLGLKVKKVELKLEVLTVGFLKNRTLSRKKTLAEVFSLSFPKLLRRPTL